jgi:hypothetical protein
VLADRRISTTNGGELTSRTAACHRQRHSTGRDLNGDPGRRHQIDGITAIDVAPQRGRAGIATTEADFS